MATSAAIEISLRNILVATDFSRASDRALKHALFIANQNHSKIYLFHAVPRESVLDDPDTLDEAAALALRQERDVQAHVAVQRGLERTQTEVITREGDVWEAMLPVIKQASIDLVVVGAHGQTGLGKLVLGSVAEKVFRHAPCPVLTVGPTSRSPRERHRSRQILYPTDFSPNSEAALPYAGLLARQTHARLAFLHVLDDEATRPWVETSESRLRAMVQREGAFTWGAELLIRRGEPAQRILEVEKEIRADLIVMGVRSSQGLGDHRMWPIAYTVVSSSHCPVLTVRREYAV
jgi:nucleotide-binding universal stress UspA family protein